MSDIFLSYKSDDRARAKIVAEALERHGYLVWWDRIIPPGKTFDQIIEEALGAAKCVIVLWSRESVSSDWVKNEAREGTRRHILVPVLIDEVKIPFEFKHIQAAQLIDWQGALPNPEFDLLLKSIEEIVGQPRKEDDGDHITTPPIAQTFSIQNLFGEWEVVNVIALINVRMRFYPNGTYEGYGTIGGRPFTESGAYNFDTAQNILLLKNFYSPYPVPYSLDKNNLQATSFTAIEQTGVVGGVFAFRKIG
jgi:hypothetical protein